MGLSIHYSGKIENPLRIDELTEEVRDICSDMGWDYYVWKGKHSSDDRRAPSKYTPEDLKGISFSPKKCETLFFTFLPNGRLYSFPLWDSDDSYTIHTKTQYAGTDVHIAVMKLLKYLDKKYLLDLNVFDEGMYWETGDEKVLLSQFEKFNFALNVVENTLTDFKALPNESPESLVERLEKLLLKKLGEK